MVEYDPFYPNIFRSLREEDAPNPHKSTERRPRERRQVQFGETVEVTAVVEKDMPNTIEPPPKRSGNVGEKIFSMMMDSMESDVTQ